MTESAAQHPNQVRADPRSAELSRLKLYIAISVFWLVGLVVVPVAVQGPWYLAFGVYSVALGIRRAAELPERGRRPVRLTAFAITMAITAITIRWIHQLVSGTANVMPSPADAFHLAAYAMLIVAILMIVHRRVPRLGLDPIIDACVGGIAAALLQWSLVLLPYVRTAGVPTGELVMNLSYSLLTLLMVVAAVLALVAGSKPSVSNRLLATALVAVFAADITATLVSAGRLPDAIALALSPVGLVIGVAGLLHPSAVGITDPPTGEGSTRRLTRRRVSVLALALITPPALMLWVTIERGVDGWTLLPALAGLALTPLVVTRLGRLVRQNEELAATEATLRSVGERLVTAESTDDVVRIITVGAEQVLGGRLVEGGLLLHPEGIDNCPVELREAASALERRLEDIDRPMTAELIQLEGRSDDHPTTAGMVVVQRRLRAVLLLSTSAPLSDDERNAVRALCRESAIAIRAVDQTEQQVRQRSEERFGALIDNSSDIVAVIDPEGALTYVSPVATRLLGHAVEDPTSVVPLELLHPDDHERASQMIGHIRFGQQESVELRLRHAKGHYLWFEVVGVDLANDPNIGGIVLNLREISDRKEAEKQLLLSEARFKSLVQHSTDLVIVVDDRATVHYASPSVRNVFGVDPEDLLGRALQSIFRNSAQDWHAAMRTAPVDGSAAPELLEFSFQLDDEEWRVIETSITDLRSEPSVHGFVLNARDVTERKQMEQRIRYQATHDELTGLANRLLLLDDLGGMLSRNSGSTTVGALVLGLDDFKDVNDSLGHASGDQLLLEVSRRITSLLEFGDVAARVGGDQFSIALERSHGEKQVTELAEQILAAIAVPFELDGREITLTASAGVVFDHDRSTTPDVMMRNADIAMYRAKDLGKRQIVVFEPNMHAASHDRLELRADLQKAVATEQFVNHYQPILELSTGKIVGAEALVRWQHPERGMLGPGVFIPLAEETGLINQIGAWVLDRACADLAGWHHEHRLTEDDFSISVNLAVQQLTGGDLVSSVRQTLARNRLPASRLILEITESTLMTDTESIRATMDELRALGARLAVDDFGTGYSSLGYIQQFDFDVLKIDKSFVDGLDSFTNQRIVKAVIELADQLEVRTVAEGIESQLQADLLCDLHCGYGQGFHFSRPVPERDFRDLLVTNRSTTQRPVG